MRSTFLASCMSCCREMALTAEGTTRTSKQVLVNFGEHRRVLKIPVGSSSAESEREALLSRIRNEFGHHIPEGASITLQIKDEDWGGVFVDYLEDCVADKSVFNLVIERGSGTWQV